MLFFDADYLPGNGHQQYDVTQDDQRFVMLRIDEVHTPVAELILVQNLFEELERRLPH